MTTTDHSRWSDDLAAYLLGALDPEEAGELERHLEGCRTCREELRWLEPAVQALPESAERQEPPRQLRETLMAEVRGDARAERRSTAPAPWRRWLLKPATGFAVLALLVAGVVGYEVGKEGDGDGGSTIEREIDGIAVTMIQEDEGGTLRLANLSQPPPGRVLEAWVLREGEVEAVQPLFVPDRHGRAEATIADLDGVEEVMVTEEPRGGSETPTGEPIFAMEVPS